MANFTRYATELRSVRGLSRNTVHRYVQAAERFCRFIEDKGRTVRTTTRDDIISWRTTVEPSRKATGFRLDSQCVKIYFDWLTETGQIKANPFPEHFKVRVKNKDITDVPTAAQFLALREAVKDTGQFGAIIEVLAGTGLRINAVLTMRGKHFNPDKRCIMVDEDMECKGSRMSNVPMTPYAANILADYVKYAKGNARVFDFNYHQFHFKLRHTVSKLAEPFKVRPHSFRHFYCCMTYYKNLDGGKFDVLWVRDAAGHSNLTITDKYLKLAKSICATEQEWEDWANGKGVTSDCRNEEAGPH